MDPDDEYEHDEWDGEDRWCHTCRGDGWGISGDDWPVDDAVNDTPGEVEKCPNCRGSGLAKDCWFW